MVTRLHIAGAAAILTLAGCTTAGSPAGRTTMAQTTAPPATTVYDPTVKAYPDETPHVIGRLTFYFNRYTPFSLR